MYARTLMIYCELARQVTRSFLEVEERQFEVVERQGDGTAFRPVPAEFNQWIRYSNRFDSNHVMNQFQSIRFPQNKTVRLDHNLLESMQSLPTHTLPVLSMLASYKLVSAMTFSFHSIIYVHNERTTTCY